NGAVERDLRHNSQPNLLYPFAPLLVLQDGSAEGNRHAKICERRHDRRCPRAERSGRNFASSAQGTPKQRTGHAAIRSAPPQRRRYESSLVRNVPGRRCIRGASARAIPRPIAKRDCWNGDETSWSAVRDRGLVAITKSRQSD